MDSNSNGYFDTAIGDGDGAFSMMFGLNSNANNGFPSVFPSANNADLDSMLFEEVPSFAIPTDTITSGGTWQPSGQGYFDHSILSYFPQQAESQVDQALGMEMPNAGASPQETPKPTRKRAAAVPVSQDASSVPAIVKKTRKSRKHKKPKSEEEEQASRNKFLERNRVAASKCRGKKKEWIDKMEAQLRDSQRINTMKQYELQDLANEVIKLKQLLFTHSSCGVEDIDKWISRESARIAEDPPRVGISRHLSMNSLASTYTGDYDGSRSNSIDSKEEFTGSGFSSRQSMEASLTTSGKAPVMSRQLSAERTAVSPHLMSRQNSEPGKGPNNQAPLDIVEVMPMSSSPMTRPLSSNSISSRGHQQRDSGISEVNTPTQPKLEFQFLDEGYGGFVDSDDTITPRTKGSPRCGPDLDLVPTIRSGLVAYHTDSQTSRTVDLPDSSYFLRSNQFDEADHTRFLAD